MLSQFTLKLAYCCGGAALECNLNYSVVCNMRVCTQPKGRPSARATIGYLVYKQYAVFTDYHSAGKHDRGL